MNLRGSARSLTFWQASILTHPWKIRVDRPIKLPANKTSHGIPRVTRRASYKVFSPEYWRGLSRLKPPLLSTFSSSLSYTCLRHLYQMNSALPTPRSLLCNGYLYESLRSGRPIFVRAPPTICTLVGQISTAWASRPR